LGSGLASAWASGLGGWGVAAASPSAMLPSTPPTAISLPSGAAMSLSVPEAGALTSTLTLSVSSSTSGSSTVTASPTAFSHRATVASVTDSPSVGTVIWMVIVPLLRARWSVGA
jgi:hypothetical protein